MAPNKCHWRRAYRFSWKSSKLLRVKWGLKQKRKRRAPLGRPLPSYAARSWRLAGSLKAPPVGSPGAALSFEIAAVREKPSFLFVRRRTIDIDLAPGHLYEKAALYGSPDWPHLLRFGSLFFLLRKTRTPFGAYGRCVSGFCTCRCQGKAEPRREFARLRKKNEIESGLGFEGGPQRGRLVGDDNK